MEFLYLIFCACMRLRFLDVETNPGPRRPIIAVCRTLFINVRSLAGNLTCDLNVASSQYDILFFFFALRLGLRSVCTIAIVNCLGTDRQRGCCRVSVCIIALVYSLDTDLLRGCCRVSVCIIALVFSLSFDLLRGCCSLKQ